jgi:hypothetical protein
MLHMQQALRGKADTRHTHSTTDISRGKLDIATLPVGSAEGTLCAGDDPRLSDERKPEAHSHPVTELQQTAATTGQVLTWSGAQWEPQTPAAATASLTSASAFLAADVSMPSANTYYDGPTVSLASGTWLVMASATIGRTTTTAGHYTMRISTGTTHYASVQQYHASVANNWAALSCNAIITLAATTTIKLQTAGTITSDVLKAATANNGSGNNATGLVAVRIA